MIDLSRERGHPVYLQIKEQLEHRIASGQLASGEALPSVRILAQQLQVNPNTVMKAYRELELEGLVVSRQGEGTFVTPPKHPRLHANNLLDVHARQYAKSCVELGITLELAMLTLAEIWQEVKDAKR